MDYIKLTKEQRDRLVEMAIKMFPDYKCWCFVDFMVIDSASESHCAYSNLEQQYIASILPYQENAQYKGEFCCHWYEFCVMHLADKIFDSIKNNSPAFHKYYSELLGKRMLTFKINPIDELWGYFINIKKNDSN